jgi:hypothetical protein
MMYNSGVHERHNKLVYNRADSRNNPYVYYYCQWKESSVRVQWSIHNSSLVLS